MRRINIIDQVAIIGAVNGGKAAAFDLAFQGKKVRLFEFPEFEENLTDHLIETATLTYGCPTEGVRLKFL